MELFLVALSIVDSVGQSGGTTTPDPLAQLDTQSTKQGILIPRMSSALREQIAKPANGLMVFDYTTQSFWF